MVLMKERAKTNGILVEKYRFLAVSPGCHGFGHTAEDAKEMLVMEMRKCPNPLPPIHVYEFAEAIEVDIHPIFGPAWPLGIGYQIIERIPPEKPEDPR